MSAENLRTLLRTLHSELEHHPTLGSEEKALLEDLAKDITALLDADQTTNPALINRLESSIADFEVSHPELVNVISKILEGLSNAGI